MHAIDTEYEVSSEAVPRLVSVAIAGTSGCRLFHHTDPLAPVAVREVLRTGAIFANAPADIVVMWRRWPELLPDIIDAYEHDRITDVLNNEKLIDIAEGMLFARGTYSLQSVAERRAQIYLAKGSDTWRLRYGELLWIPVELWPDDARKYALDDPAATFAAHLEQQAFRARFSIDILVDAPFQARAHLALYVQSLRGIHVDPAQVAAVDVGLATEIKRLEQHCIETGLARPKTEKPDAAIQRNKKNAAAMLVAYAAETGQEVEYTEPTSKFPDGQVSLGEESLNTLKIEPGHPLDSYRKLGSLKTMRTGWVEPLSHGVVHTKYDPIVSSGRSSSAGFKKAKKGSDKTVATDDDEVADAKSHMWAACSRNLQNFPKPHTLRKLGVGHIDIRGCLVPRPGYVFIVSDFSALELVTLAQVQIDWFGRSALGDALRDPKRGDPHGEFGAEMLGIPYPSDTRLPPAPGEFDKSLPAHKEARDGAKAWNFGKPGGMGQARFIAHARDEYGVEVTPEEERRHTASWHRKWPEMRMFFDRVSALEDHAGYITIVQPRSGRVRGRLRFPDGCNTNFQGLGADVAKLAMWWLLRAFLGFGEGGTSNPLYGGAQVLFVHDENVTEVLAGDPAPCPKHTEKKCKRCGGRGFIWPRAERAQAEQDRIMVAAGAYWCPDVPIKVESAVVDRYAK